MKGKPMIVLSGTTLGAPWDEIAAFSYARHREWAVRHGGRAALNILDVVAHGRPASWLKLLALVSVLGREHVVWFDADCVPAPAAPAEAFLAPSGKFRTAIDRNGINCGVMAFPPGDWVVPFLHHWYEAPTVDEVHNIWWEQYTLRRLLHEPDIAQRLGDPIAENSVIHAAGVEVAGKLAWLKDKCRE
jgi:hypothetical protein